MATCPRCKGHLTDSHRCPKRSSIVALEIAMAAIAGGFSGLLIVAIFDPRGQMTDIDVVFIVLGALAGVAINRSLR